MGEAQEEEGGEDNIWQFWQFWQFICEVEERRKKKKKKKCGVDILKEKIRENTKKQKVNASFAFSSNFCFLFSLLLVTRCQLLLVFQSSLLVFLFFSGSFFLLIFFCLWLLLVAHLCITVHEFVGVVHPLVFIFYFLFFKCIHFYE